MSDDLGCVLFEVGAMKRASLRVYVERANCADW